ncbi:peptidase M16 [Lentibacillus kapialis]|uniref:Peptidase M16 n=1 Tax=Lentibacillus kapialis TaxID=340214 RepID=A0A917Q282_9BACI|nr:pitrilysin family protein [Lentibacillus kapialis]GGK07409.1 peptidase M16 [Lentibacillus kapialis]
MLTTTQSEPEFVLDPVSTKDIVSFSFMVKVGVVNEEIDENGISHLLEHVILRGTNKVQLDNYFEKIGGKYNAFTGREFTCYYAKVLKEDFHEAFSLLSDYVFNPSFTEEDLFIEKKIINEEILHYEDNIMQKVKDRALFIATRNHPVSYDILGSYESLSNINLDHVYSYHRRHYDPSNIVISISGNFEPERIQTLKNDLKSKIKSTQSDKFIISTKETNETNINEVKPNFNYGDFREKNNKANKSYICHLYNGFSRFEFDKLLPLEIINYSLSGSRMAILNQALREKGGYVYSLYSYPIIFQGGGLLGLVTATNPNNENEVLNLINQTIKSITKNGIPNDLFISAKKGLRSAFVFELENTLDRMFFYGREALFGEKHYDNFEDKLNNLDIKTVNDMLHEIFESGQFSLVSSGTNNV